MYVIHVIKINQAPSLLLAHVYFLYIISSRVRKEARAIIIYIMLEDGLLLSLLTV